MIDGVIIGVSALLSLVGARFLRPAPALCLSVLLGILQIYPTTHITASLGAIWQIATWVSVYRNRSRLGGVRRVAYPYAALVLVSILVLAWSPDRTAGATLVAQLLGLGATVALAIVVARSGTRAERAAYSWLAAMVAISAVTILVFRFVPAIEDGYFHSPLFGALNGNDLAAHFFTTERNNVLDKTKSGGLFFVNANAASLFAGASAAVLGARAARSGGPARIIFALVAMLDLASALATGSKTAVYLASAACVLVGLGVAVLWRRGARRGRPFVLAGLSMAVGFGILAVPMVVERIPVAPAPVQRTASIAPAASPVPSVASAPSATSLADQSSLATQSADALGTRTRIWQVAALLFRSDPLGTFGYGGWQVRYAPIAVQRGLDPGFPPHDWVIDTWADTGPSGLALEFALVVVIALAAHRRLTMGARAARLSVALALLGLGWILVHGLADNTGFYGGPRLIPVVALALGMVLDVVARCGAGSPGGRETSSKATSGPDLHPAGAGRG